METVITHSVVEFSQEFYLIRFCAYPIRLHIHTFIQYNNFNSFSHVSIFHTNPCEIAVYIEEMRYILKQVHSYNSVIYLAAGTTVSWCQRTIINNFWTIRIENSKSLWNKHIEKVWNLKVLKYTTGDYWSNTDLALYFLIILEQSLVLD